METSLAGTVISGAFFPELIVDGSILKWAIALIAGGGAAGVFQSDPISWSK